jgi:hypothetical protein
MILRRVFSCQSNSLTPQDAWNVVWDDEHGLEIHDGIQQTDSLITDEPLSARCEKLDERDELDLHAGHESHETHETHATHETRQVRKIHEENEESHWLTDHDDNDNSNDKDTESLSSGPSRSSGKSGLSGISGSRVRSQTQPSTHLHARMQAAFQAERSANPAL